jgi:hypothetical protein
MSLHQVTSKLTPQQTNIIPAGKFIYTDLTFQLDPVKFIAGESYPRQGKPLVPAHFSYAHHNPDFTLVAQPQLSMNYNTYIYNALTGYT